MAQERPVCAEIVVRLGLGVSPVMVTATGEDKLPSHQEALKIAVANIYHKMLRMRTYLTMTAHPQPVSHHLRIYFLLQTEQFYFASQSSSAHERIILFKSAHKCTRVASHIRRQLAVS